MCSVCPLIHLPGAEFLALTPLNSELGIVGTQPHIARTV